MPRKIKQYTNPFLKPKGEMFAPSLPFPPTLQSAIKLHQQGQHANAEVIYRQILQVQPKNSDALHLLGLIEYERGNHQVAVDMIGQAITLSPDLAEAYSNRGVALKELKQLNAALESYDKAIALKPSNADTHYNRGVVLKELKQLDAAIISYDKAIALRPDFADAYYFRGIALKEIKRFEEALMSFEKVFILNPNYQFIRGEIIHIMMYINKWDSYYDLLRSINNDVLDKKLSASPFGYQGICDNPRLLSEAAKIYSHFKYPSKIKLENKIRNKLNNDKIKIGYLCGEFRNQATSILMINLWESHNKDKFEVIGLDNGWDDGSPLRKRIEKAFDKLLNISDMSDLSAISLIKDQKIDILINLNIFFGLQRNNIFAHKPAPIQVNYLGFPGTLGVDYIDYIIADKIVIPTYFQKFYSEKIVYLPNSYQVNDRHREIADKVFTKEELGLPKEGFIFCCFNNNYKIIPPTFDGWVRILKAVEDSVLWLLEDNPSAAINLRKEAHLRGLDPSRLVFAKRMNFPEHLARHRAADLFLDTLPYNAHTTASDALWAGLPVLTCMGDSFASRVAASLLNAIELPELVAQTQKDYEALAIELAINPVKLKMIKNKLNRNKLTTALFDTPQFTKHLETAYTKMYERYHHDLTPEHIYVG
jgi:predicted O-linked N-acetylglucosamine transferase (SPINDLY family)